MEEAGILWHNLIAALISTDTIAVKESLEKLLAEGHIPRREALTGFIGSFLRIAISVHFEVR